MSGPHVDRKKVARYIARELPAEEQKAVHDHFLACGRCWDLLAKVEVRKAREEALKERRLSRARTSSLRRYGAYAGASAGVITAALFLLIPRKVEAAPWVIGGDEGSIVARFTHGPGTIETLPSGEPLAGDADLFFVGPAAFKNSGASVSNVAELGSITLSDARTPRVREAFGDLQFDVKSPSGLTVEAGKCVISATTASFRVTSWPGKPLMVTPFSGQIRVAIQGQKSAYPLSPGETFLGESKVARKGDTPISPDLPTFLLPSKGSPITYDEQMFNKLRVPVADEKEILTGLAATLRDRSSAVGLFQVATVLSSEMDRDLAAPLAREALARDRSLKGVQDESIWRVLRLQGSFMGDQQLARILLTVLKSRPSAANKAERQEIGLWQSLATTPEQNWRRVEAICGEIEEGGRREDTFAVEEARTFAASDCKPTDVPDLQRASKRLEAYLNRSGNGLTTAERAFAYQRLNEALFYLEEKRRSVHVLGLAVSLWPVPRWKVNLAARMTESLDRYDSKVVWGLLRDGLSGDACYYTYLRALNAINSMARTPADRKLEVQLIAWIAGTFPDLAEAQATMAPYHANLTEQISPADSWMQGAVRLCGGADNLPGNARVFWGRSLWRRGLRKEADHFAGVDQGKPRYPDWLYFSYTARPELALRLLKLTPESERDRDFLKNEGDLYQRLGERKLAIVTFRAYLSTGLDAHGQILPGRKEDVLKTYLALAELGSNGGGPYAQKVLHMLAAGGIALGDGIRSPMLLKIRALIAMADYSAASILLQKYFSLAPEPEFRDEARALLVRIPAKFKPKSSA